MLFYYPHNSVSAGIKATHRAILSFSPRYVAPIVMKLGTDEWTGGLLLRAKFHPIGATIKV